MANMTPQIPIFEVKNTIKSLIDRGASEQEVDKFISDTGYTLDEIREFSLDKTTGVPLMERLKIGLSPNLKSTEKTMKEIKSNPGYTGRRKMDIEAELAANQKLQSKLFRGSKDLAKKYEGLPDIRSRFRGAPGRQRKLVKGVKNPMKRAEILQEDRLKRDGPIRGRKN